MPMLYSIDDNGQLYFVSKLDNTQKKEAAGLSAMRKFQSLDRQARTDTNDNALDSIHQNTINCVRKVSDNEFSTSGLDGQLVVWDLKVNLISIPFLSHLYNQYKYANNLISNLAPGEFYCWSQDSISKIFFYIKEIRKMLHQLKRCINVKSETKRKKIYNFSLILQLYQLLLYKIHYIFS